MLAAADAAEMAAAFRAARGGIDVAGGDGVGVGTRAGAVVEDDEWDAFDDGRGAASAGAAAAADVSGAAAAPSAHPQQQQNRQAPQPPQPPPSISSFDLEAEFDALHAETASATDEARRARSAAEGPTPEMFEQCQELLQLFGIPYIVAPMEAEAQCAFLDAAGLVDGVATDDNDVFLFGGQRVFRNLFADSRRKAGGGEVEEYLAADVERELGLTREHLASLAQLLGSDYAEGVGGVGVVNALEVLRAFGPGTEGLARFRAWMESPDDVLLEQVSKRMAAGQGSGEGKRRKREEEVEKEEMKKGKEAKDKATPTKKRDDRSGDGDGSSSSSSSGNGNGSDSSSSSSGSSSSNGDEESDEEEQQATEASNTTAILAEFKRRHRGARVSWRLPDSFPSDAVAAAYRAPRVDASRSRFAQHPPLEAELRAFCARAFGWRDDRTDAVLGPALRGVGGGGGGGPLQQATMHQFLTSRQRFAKIRSTRLAKAVAGITQRGVNREIMLVGGEGEDGEGGGEGGGAGGRGSAPAPRASASAPRASDPASAPRASDPASAPRASDPASASASARGKGKRGQAPAAAAAKKKKTDKGKRVQRQQAGRRSASGGGAAAATTTMETMTIDTSSSSSDFDSDFDEPPAAKKVRASRRRRAGGEGGEGLSAAGGGGGGGGGRGRGGVGGRGGRRGGRT